MPLIRYLNLQKKNEEMDYRARVFSDDNRVSVEEAVKRWKANDLEIELSNLGMCAAIVRARLTAEITIVPLSAPLERTHCMWG